MKIAVVGAGPAGLAAGRALANNAHRPVLFESAERVGGRTFTIRRDNHVIDSGAGWLASFYSETLRLLRELDMLDALVQLDLAAASCLSKNGKITPVPNSPIEAMKTPLISPWEKARMISWAIGLLIRQPRPNLAPDLRFDKIDAKTHIVRKIGPGAADRVFTPMVSAVFSGLDLLSASLIRAWVRAGIGANFYALEDGMDSLWTRVAEELDLQLAAPVREITIGRGAGVDITTDSDRSERFDACIVTIPLTRARKIIKGINLPGWFDQVQYAPHFRVYASISSDLGRADIHPIDNDSAVATISRGPAGRLWGVIPENRSAALVGTSGEWGKDLIEAKDGKERLWKRAREIDPELFELEEASLVEVIRWNEAVPVFSPGHFGRVASLKQKPPLIFAGDWLVQPCIEGAVRSGLTAANIFGRT